MSDELLHGSMVFVFVWLVVGGLGVPLPEDVALLATGVLVHRGVVLLPIAMAVVFVGVLGADAILFSVAKRLGPAAYERRVFRRLLPPDRRSRIERAFQRYGGRLIFLARHVIGLRGAVFAMAGIHGMSFWRFLAWDALAACVSLPLVVALGYFGSQHVERVRRGIETGEELVLLAVVISLLVYASWRRIRSLERTEDPHGRSVTRPSRAREAR